MSKILVQLNPKMAKRNQCLVDPSNGITITSARYQKDSGAQLVFDTAFVRARIASGELVEVRTPAPAPKNDKLVEVIFTKDAELGGKQFKKGDAFSMPESEAKELAAQKLVKIG